MLRPCIECGTPSPATRCPEHTRRPKDTRRRRGKGQAAADPVWRALSRRARKAQPWCSDCGATEDLTCDHRIPKSIAPDLVHCLENVAVLCRPCNSRRGTKFAEQDARQVLDRLQASYALRPTSRTRRHIEAARAALDQPTRGNAPVKGVYIPAGKARRAMNPASSAVEVSS